MPNPNSGEPKNSALRRSCTCREQFISVKSKSWRLNNSKLNTVDTWKYVPRKFDFNQLIAKKLRQEITLPDWQCKPYRLACSDQGFTSPSPSSIHPGRYHAQIRLNILHLYLGSCWRPRIVIWEALAIVWVVIPTFVRRAAVKGPSPSYSTCRTMTRNQSPLWWRMSRDNSLTTLLI